MMKYYRHGTYFRPRPGSVLKESITKYSRSRALKNPIPVQPPGLDGDAETAEHPLPPTVPTHFGARGILNREFHTELEFRGRPRPGPEYQSGILSGFILNWISISIASGRPISNIIPFLFRPLLY